MARSPLTPDREVTQDEADQHDLEAQAVVGALLGIHEATLQDNGADRLWTTQEVADMLLNYAQAIAQDFNDEDVAEAVLDYIKTNGGEN